MKVIKWHSAVCQVQIEHLKTELERSRAAHLDDILRKKGEQELLMEQVFYLEQRTKQL